MARLYQYRYARDPYEAKAKLRSLFEDIFSVNQSDQISYKDIIDQHDLIHTHTLGNYKTLVKKILFNNGSPEIILQANSLTCWISLTKIIQTRTIHVSSFSYF